MKAYRSAWRICDCHSCEIEETEELPPYIGAYSVGCTGQVWRYLAHKKGPAKKSEAMDTTIREDETGPVEASWFYVGLLRRPT